MIVFIFAVELTYSLSSWNKSSKLAHNQILGPKSTRFQILGGYVLDAFLSAWTLLIKSLGLALAVSSGHSLGKEVSMWRQWHLLNWILWRLVHLRDHLFTCRVVWLDCFPNFSSSFDRTKVRGAIGRLRSHCSSLHSPETEDSGRCSSRRRVGCIR